MAPAVIIAPNGNITVDGKLITPEQAASDANIAVEDLHKLVTALHNKTLLSWKNAEKAVVYLAGIVGASNGFTTFTMPASLREWIVGGSAFVLGMIHISTPAKTV